MDLPEDTEVEYFTAEEIAAYLRISVEEFYSWAAFAELVPVLPGGDPDAEPLYPGSDVEDFLISIGVLEGDSEW